MDKISKIENFDNCNYLCISLNYGATIENGSIEALNTLEDIDDFEIYAERVYKQLEKLKNETPGTYFYDDEEHLVIIKLRNEFI